MGKIILAGSGGSGKDHMRKVLVNQGFKYGISYTSRAPRAGEKEGIDYYFLTKEDFEKRIEEGFWLEYDNFGGNLYGTSKQQFEEYDLFIMTRSGMAQLEPEYRSRVTIIWIDIDENIRRERLAGRGWDAEKIETRLKIDREEFDGFTKPEFDIRITTPDF